MLWRYNSVKADKIHVVCTKSSGQIVVVSLMLDPIFEISLREQEGCLCFVRVDASYG